MSARKKGSIALDPGKLSSGNGSKSARTERFVACFVVSVIGETAEGLLAQDQTRPRSNSW